MEVGAFRAKEAAAYLGIGMTKFYELIKDGKISKGLPLSHSCKLWRKKTLDEFLDRLEQEQTAGE